MNAIKALLFGYLLLGMIYVVQAGTVGSSASLVWDYDQAKLADIDGFRVVCNDSQTWEGTAQTAPLLDMTLAPGNYDCYVEAFNAAAKSGPSNTVTFRFVDSAPEAPTVLRLVF